MRRSVPVVRLLMVLMVSAVTACTASTDRSAGSTVAEPVSNSASVPSALTTSDTVPGVFPEDFTTTAAVAIAADGTTCELCVWLADTADRRSRGLMFVTDLGPADAMAFRYPDPHTGTFWMKNTLLPLSIAFYSPDGDFMDAFDMEPCTDDPCPNYSTPSEFLVAVEVPQGGLDALGLTPGSTLELLDLPCT